MEYKIEIEYNKNKNNLLSRLSEKYGSDKGASNTETKNYLPWEYHTYTDLYDILFNLSRFKIESVFECGLGTNDESFKSNMTKNGKPGASLKMWKDYFPNAKIFGADIDEKILFSEERIITFHMDQTSKDSINDVWSKIPDKFDIFIDDGLHEFHAGVILYENSINKIKDNGVYIIEDVMLEDLPKYKEYFKSKNIDATFITLKGPKTRDDNNIILLGSAYDYL